MLESKWMFWTVSIMMAILVACPLYAAEYKNSELGFSVTYPDNLDVQSSPLKSTVFYAISATKMPWATVSIVSGTTLHDAVHASFAGNSDASNIAIKAIRDDATASDIKVQIASLSYLWQGTYDCDGLVLGAKNGDKWILFAIATVPVYDSNFDLKEYEKILKSFKFNE